MVPGVLDRFCELGAGEVLKRRDRILGSKGVHDGMDNTVAIVRVIGSVPCGLPSFTIASERKMWGVG